MRRGHLAMLILRWAPPQRRNMSSCGSGGCGSGPGGRIADFAQILSQARNKPGGSGDPSADFFDGNFKGGSPVIDPSMLQGMQQTLQQSMTTEMRDSMRAMMESLQRGEGLPQMGMMAFGVGENEKGKKVARGAKMSFDPNTGKFSKDFVEKQLEDDDPMLPKETVEDYTTDGAVEVEFEGTEKPERPPEIISAVEVEVETCDSSRCGAVEAALISSSSIEYCEKTDQTVMPCKKKMITTISVGNGQASGSEEVVFIRGAKDKTGDSGGGEVFFEPVRVTVSKSRVQYRYPVFYVRNFNAKPYEEQILTGLVNSCNDSPDPKKATCGMAMDANEQPIPYSQGFCCQCSICQVSGMCPSKSRGQLTCNIFDKTAAASCLRFGPLWYSGFSVGSGVLWYHIDLTLSTTNTSGDGKSRTAKLHLGPDVTADFSKEFEAGAKLVGDFTPPEMPLVLSEKMLFVPTSPRKHERVLAGPREWIILDRRLVSETGNECDKVGVSYKAFVSQGNGCGLGPNTCLSEQLEDYRDRDIENKKSGKRGQYMAHFLGDFTMIEGNATVSPYIAYWMRGSLNTMITLTMTADNLQYVLSVSPGEIVNVSVSNETIAASTRDGVVTVTVRNTGTITSEYSIDIRNCTAGVLPMVAQSVSLEPKQRVSRSFDLFVQNAFLNGAIHCDASLRNTRGEVIHTKPVEFHVVPIDWTNGTQGGGFTKGDAAVNVQGSTNCEGCDWYNLICYMGRGCSWQPLVFLMAIVTFLSTLLWFSWC